MSKPDLALIDIALANLSESLAFYGHLVEVQHHDPLPGLYFDDSSADKYYDRIKELQIAIRAEIYSND
ncbi:MAG: hypothetical protein Q8M08_03575 [Bacteroidales bacterium]|nr:hypothetical protein [Bacteroidales bacterium]